VQILYFEFHYFEFQHTIFVDCMAESSARSKKVTFVCLTEWQINISASDCTDSDHGSDWFICPGWVCIIPCCWSDLLSCWLWWRHRDQLFHLLCWGNYNLRYVFSYYMYSWISAFVLLAS